MAVAIGTNSGFVTVAPTVDPADGGTITDNNARVMHDTSPVGTGTITEVGWYCSGATEAANFEVGLYAADGAVVPGEAGTLLQVSRTNAKGTTEGWKVVTGLSWPVTSSTAYWLGIQIDNTATATSMDSNATAGTGADILTVQTTLPDPFGGGAITDADQCLAIYALWKSSGTTQIPTLLTLSVG